MALDYLLASEGGFCQFIGNECCTWTSDYDNKIEEHLHRIKELQHKAKNIAEEGWNPFRWIRRCRRMV